MKNSNPYLFTVIGITATAGLLFGFDTSIIAGALPFIKKEFDASNFMLEMVVSSCILGALFGALLSGKLSDVYGRRKTLTITGLIFIGGTLLATVSSSLESLIIARVIIGFGVGIGSYTTPLFIAEIAPPQSRGQLVLWNGSFLTGGQVIAFLINYSFTYSGNWRMMIFSGIIPASALTFGMFFIPESPKWLFTKGKIDKSLQILCKIRKSYEVASMELNLIQNLGNTKKVGIREVFSKKTRPVLLIGLLMGIFQQFMGINTVMYYGPHIIKQIGFSSSVTQMIGTLGLGITNFLFTITTLLFIDKIGRRRFLLIGSFLAAMSLFAMIFLLSGKISSIRTYLAFGCLIFYIIGYCISLGSLFWLMISEIFPLKIRGQCMSIVAAIQWGANFLVAVSFLSILTTLGLSATFSMYGIISLIIFLFVYFKVPETKGVPLEIIERNINLGIITRKLGEKNAT
ncbi:MAG: sugar porter family MFS transporter [Burkholderiales bacterium]|nr:sugar porter family MFS transporter [Burkholderiales bacterium]